MWLQSLLCGTLLFPLATDAYLGTINSRRRFICDRRLLLSANQGELLTISDVFGEENEFVLQASNEHKTQFEAGSSVFGSSACVASDRKETEWKDESFIAMSVGEGNAGPSEKLLGIDGHFVYQTKQPILSEKECQYWIQTARDAIAQGGSPDNVNAGISKVSSMDTPVTNSELNEARLLSLPPDAIVNLCELLESRLYPILESRFGRSASANIGPLTVYDGLILGGGPRPQPVHRDASLLTINIALSAKEDFDGGGTYIEGLQLGSPVVVDRGVALCHAGGAMHAGTGIQRGERWQLVLFCLAEKEPQIARRCHAIGIDKIAEGDFAQAEMAFRSGLKYAPQDHLLIQGIGRIHHQRGDKAKGFKYLAESANQYPISPTAGIALGKMKLAERKPRAALRRFDRVLEQVGDQDQKHDSFMSLRAEIWDARKEAARCALLCAEYDAKRNQNNMQWTKKMLPKAMERLKLCLDAAPSDEHLRAMMGRSLALLKQAQAINS